MLPRLGLRWAGFRKPRRQVCRRIFRRLSRLGLPGLSAYRDRLEADPQEWAVLDGLCRVTISRFYRDRRVWEVLGDEVLPELSAASGGAVRAWSAGCASGEEPYTLALVWTLRGAGAGAGASLEVLGTDVDPALLERARRAVYAPGTLKELPDGWAAAAFEPAEGGSKLRERFRRPVRFALHDVRDPPPDGSFDLVLCRYLAFTYLEPATAERVFDRFRAILKPGGALVVGGTDRLPDGARDWPAHPRTPLVRLRPGGDG